MNIEIDETQNPTLIFRNAANDRYYFHGQLESGNVAPGPVRLSGMNVDEGDGRFFLFWIADCMSPPMYVVLASSLEDAYEIFVDWQVDQLKIEDDDLKDYIVDSATGEVGKGATYTSSGVPIDTESVSGQEVFLLAALTMADDRTIWNMAAMFLDRVTRSENEYDESAKFRRDMAKCCTPYVTVDPQKTEKAVEAWKQARNLSHYKF